MRELAGPLDSWASVAVPLLHLNGRARLAARADLRTMLVDPGGSLRLSDPGRCLLHNGVGSGGFAQSAVTTATVEMLALRVAAFTAQPAVALAVAETLMADPAPERLVAVTYQKLAADLRGRLRPRLRLDGDWRSVSPAASHLDAPVLSQSAGCLAVGFVRASRSACW